MIFIVIIVIVFCFYILAIKPNHGRQKDMKPFCDVYIAHRGLFNNTDIPENSIKAFKKAVENGYGIELDVQLTADDKLVVFHDETLERICNDKRILNELTYDELLKLNLLNTDEKIPLFSDVLNIIGGKVPLIIEIKPEGRYIENIKMVNDLMSSYRGIFCIESFHPLVLSWLRRNNNAIIRGQLATDMFKEGKNKPLSQKILLTNLLLNFLSKPDFIAFDHKHKNSFSYYLVRKLYKPVNVAWTIKNQAELDNAKEFQVIIFDSFIPSKKQ